MPSRLVLERQKRASAVIAAGEAHADPIAAEIDALLSPYLHKGEQMPDVSLLMQLAMRAVADASDRMVTADEAHFVELSDDASPREGRDEAAHELYDELSDLRDWLTGIYDAAALERLGFAHAPPRDPAQLERFTREVVRALSAKELPEPHRKGVRWDPDGTVLRIERLHDALLSHFMDVAREAREAEATRLARHAAISAHDERFSRATAFLAGIFRLAGHADLAHRVRPPTRRHGHVEADAPPGEPGKAADPEPRSAALGEPDGAVAADGEPARPLHAQHRHGAT
ncbi:hypothetical protein SOCE26_006560 [Sorangium cellulosum]|uniref:Uncharacterized protein n=1 Tax=Sorangium cellulosum TaxID=56 RepID=A0A2L0EJ00_SORCE|nr:hypothetical protein [Sorangium cellulosum]AUX39272.1 hypothetical protein SOCE26_006560 [Sorangium cellulosum]